MVAPTPVSALLHAVAVVKAGVFTVLKIIVYIFGVDTLAGISQDRTSEELQELRDIRDQSKGAARISREIAGVDAQRSEQEFLEYANQTVADTEFDALIGLSKETSAPAAEEESAPRTQIPEE